MADGKIIIETDISVKESERRLNDLKETAEQSGNSISNSMKSSADKVAREWDRAKASYDSSAREMIDLTRQLEDAQEALKVSESFGLWDIEGITRNKQLIEEINAELSQTSKLHDRNTLALENTGIKAEDLSEKIKTSSSGGDKLANSFKKASVEANKTSVSAKGISDGVSSGVKKLGKYALALFSIRSAYTFLRRLSNAWLNSDDAGAKQVKANIEAINSALSNALAPVITYIANLIMTVVGYANALLKAFFGVDLFAKKVSKNTAKTGGSIKKATKEMKRFNAQFDTAEVISSSIADNIDGSGGGGGMELPAPQIPTIGMEKFVDFIDNMKDRLKPFIDTIKSINLDNLKNAFANLGSVAKNSLDIIGDSFFRIMNDTMGPYYKMMAEDIIPKGLNTVARALDRMNPAVERLLKDFIEPLYNWFMLKFVPKGLEAVFSTFEAISGIVSVVIDSFARFWGSSVGKAIAFVGGELVLAILSDIKSIFDEVVDSIDYFFEKLDEGEPVAVAISVAIGAIVSGLLAWKVAMIAINKATALFKAISPFGWITIAIASVIAIILVLYKNWDNIVKFFEDSLKGISKWFSETWEGIKKSFDDLCKKINDWWDGLVNNLKAGWNSFLDMGSNAIEGIKNGFNGMKNFVVGYMQTIGNFWSSIIGGMWNGIKNVIDNIKGVFNGLIDFISGVFTGNWSRAWKGIVSVFQNIVSGIANIFKAPINAMIDGINAFIRGVNRINIPSWVPFVGGKGFHIGTIPRLAKGGVLRSETLNIAGEYAGARTNPEIVTPQNIMAETFEGVLSRLGSFGNGSQTLNLILNGKEIASAVNEQSNRDNIIRNGGMPLDFI